MFTVLTNQQLQANWPAAKEKIQHNWPELSDSDIRECDRDTRKLIARINHKTGATLPEIEAVLESIAMGEGIMENLSKQATAAVESTQEAAAAALEQTQQSAEDLAASVQEGYAETERLVRSKPMESIAVCFGVGLISGVIIGLSMRGR